MANSSISSKTTNQKKRSWLNESIGCYGGFAEGLKGTPRKHYTSSVINGDEPSPKRSRTGRPLKEVELYFSDDEDDMIDPHGYMRNWVQRQHPAHGIKSTTFCDSSFHSSVFSFLSSDSEGDSNMGRNDSSIERSISRFTHEEFGDSERSAGVQMENQDGLLEKNQQGVVDHGKSQDASSEPSLNADHSDDTPRNDSSLLLPISRIIREEWDNGEEDTLVSNKDGSIQNEEKDEADPEDVENIVSTDLVDLQSNLERSKIKQVEVPGWQQTVAEKNDKEEFCSKTSLRIPRTTKKNVNCRNKFIQFPKTNNVSSSGDRKECKVGGNSWLCKICSRPFNNKSKAQYHSHTHRNWEELQTTQIFHAKCETCDKIFFNRQQFNDHVDMHRGKKAHLCPICKKKFTQKGVLTSHLFVHLDPGEKARAKQGWKHECNFCQNKFKTPSHLHTHLVAHTGEKPFHCHKCRRQFTQQSTLTTHMRSHNPATRRPFRCVECTKCFTTKQNLTRHEKIVHLKLNDVQCPRCNKKFATKSNMVRHLNGVHRGIRNPCSHCDKTFTQKGKLRIHEKRAHPKELARFNH